LIYSKLSRSQTKYGKKARRITESLLDSLKSLIGQQEQGLESSNKKMLDYTANFIIESYLSKRNITESKTGLDEKTNATPPPELLKPQKKMNVEQSLDLEDLYTIRLEHRDFDIRTDRYSNFEI